MSEENLAVVRRLFDALGSANYEEAASELHPNAEWHNTAMYPGPRVVRGAKAIEDFWRDMSEAYTTKGGAIEISNVADADDVVVIELRGRVRGTGSGIPIDTRWAHSFRLRDAKVLRVKTYGRYIKALEAAGLRE